MKLNQRNHRHKSGAAVLIVLILVFLMSALAAVNNKSLSRLNQELRRIEETQQARFMAGPPENQAGKEGTDEPSAAEP